MLSSPMINLEKRYVQQVVRTYEGYGTLVARLMRIAVKEGKLQTWRDAYGWGQRLQLIPHDQEAFKEYGFVWTDAGEDALGHRRNGFLRVATRRHRLRFFDAPEQNLIGFSLYEGSTKLKGRRAVKKAKQLLQRLSTDFPPPPQDPNEPFPGDKFLLKEQASATSPSQAA